MKIFLMFLIFLSFLTPIAFAEEYHVGTIEWKKQIVSTNFQFMFGLTLH
jgi:hypothetical protein